MWLCRADTLVRRSSVLLSNPTPTAADRSVRPDILCSLVTDRLHRLPILELVMDGILVRKYDYRRRLPHFQNPDTCLIHALSANLSVEPFSEAARDVILGHCARRSNGRRFDLHAAVVMPDHVHLLLTPLSDSKGWPYPLPAILKSIKGTSARSVNKLLENTGPVLAGRVFRSCC